MSETNAKADDELLNFNWRSNKGYSRLKAAKLLVRKAEAEDIKAIQHKMGQEGESYKLLPYNVRQKPWSESCSDEKRRYQAVWDEKLKFIREKQLEEKEQKEKKRNILDSKKDFQAVVVQRNRVLDKTSMKNDEDDDNLYYLINNLKLYEKAYSEELKQVINKFKTIYPIYDMSLACKEITLFCLSSLSNEDARNYCEQAATASLAIQEKLASLDYRETHDGTPVATEGESSLQFSLDSCCQRYQFIRLILQTVLTLETLTTEDRDMFQKYLEVVNIAIDKYEACYVYIRLRAYLNGNDANYDDEKVQNFIEKCEQLLIREDAAHIRRFLVAVTALHFNRELQCPILKFSIERYKRLSASDDTVVEKAISILNQQNVKVCPSAQSSPLESIGLIPKCGRPDKKSMACWCNNRNYLCISGNSKVDFPIYIHKSEIIKLMKLIRDQFKFDFDGQYERETVLDLPHEPLSSLVVYWSKCVENAKDIQGQLRSGEETIQLDGTDYYVRLPGVKESYQALEKAISKRLINESEKYTAWFRKIIKQSGKDIDSDRDFVLFAHAKVVSECARNLSTWMVNLMCLDVIENDITLNGQFYTNNREMYSPWRLFFEHHSMTGGSYHNQMGEGTENRNQDEIESKELLIVMNWLCIFWLGNENVAMVNDSDINLADFEQVSRTKLEAAERYARTCILNMLYYRMYSIASWDCNHFEEVLLLKSSPPFATIPRRILGRMFFDGQPLRLIKDDDATNFNGSPDEKQLKDRWLESSKETDRDEVYRQSIKRFERLIETTQDGNGLREFYQEKLQKLKSRKPFAIQGNK